MTVATDIEMIVYPVEIRPGVVVKVQAPRDMTKAEAEKVGRVLVALGDGERQEGGQK